MTTSPKHNHFHELSKFWSDKYVGDGIHIDIVNQTVTKVSAENQAQSAYSSNLFEAQGKRVFQVQIDKKHKGSNKDNIVVGITDDINGKFKNGDFAANKRFVYYGYRSDGKSVRYPERYHSYGKKFSTGDNIAVIVDFSKSSVAFCLNGENLGIAYDININGFQNGYRFAVRMKTLYDCLKIVSWKEQFPIYNRYMLFNALCKDLARI